MSSSDILMQTQVAPLVSRVASSPAQVEAKGDLNEIPRVEEVAKGIVKYFNHLDKDSRSRFMKALELDFIAYFTYNVAHDELDKQIMMWFTPEMTGIGTMLRAPFEYTLETVKKALKMQAFVKMSMGQVTYLLFFEESPLVYDTLFEARGEMPGCEFSEVMSVGLKALKNSGCSVTTWVKYVEFCDRWSWEGL